MDAPLFIGYKLVLIPRPADPTDFPLDSNLGTGLSVFGPRGPEFTGDVIIKPKLNPHMALGIVASGN